MKPYVLVAAVLLSGCNVLKNMTGTHSTPGPSPLPDDFTVTGITAVDHQWISPLQCAGRQVVVEVLRPNATQWDQANEWEVKIDTVGAGGGGVLFKNICYPTYDSNGTLIRLDLTGKPYAPTGTQYKIRSMAASTDHSLY